MTLPGVANNAAKIKSRSSMYAGIALPSMTSLTHNIRRLSLFSLCITKLRMKGSGRYSIINSLGNVPVLYMLVLDGWGGDKWGARGLAGTEAVVGAVGAMILLAYFMTRKKDEAAAEGIAVAD